MQASLRVGEPAVAETPRSEPTVAETPRGDERVVVAAPASLLFPSELSVPAAPALKSV